MLYCLVIGVLQTVSWFVFMKDFPDRCRSQALNTGVFYLSAEVVYKLHDIESTQSFFSNTSLLLMMHC